MYVFKVTATIAIVAFGLTGIIGTATYLFWYTSINPEAMPGAVAYVIAMAAMLSIFTACYLHNRSAKP